MPGSFGGDSQLLALSRLAAAGRRLPRLRLLCEGWLVLGTPVDDIEFERCLLQAVDVALRLAGRARRRSDPPVDAHRQVVRELLQIASAGRAAAAADPSALSLTDVLIKGPTDDALEVPAMRVAIDSVSAWWVVSSNLVR